MPTAKASRRTLLLYAASLSAALRRLRYDLAKELVIGICSLVLLATFFYIFNDFLNVQIASLSPRMRDAFAVGLALAVLGTATVAASRSLRAERAAPNTLNRTAFYLGESPAVRRSYLALRVASVLGFDFGLAWFVIGKWLLRPGQWPWSVALLVQGGALAMVALVTLRLPLTPSSRALRPLLPARVQSPVATLASWRAGQILRRSRASRLCLFAASLFLGLVLVVSWRHGPFFAAVIATFVAGQCTAATLAFQVADDLQHAWLERCLGVSHNDFMRAYYRIGLLLGGVTGVVAMLFYGLFSVSSVGLGPLVINALKLLVIGALPAGLCPMLIFQVDARRPALPILTVLIVGLFLATAIYAYWIALGLVVFLKYYAERSQAGRFYRA